MQPFITQLWEFHLNKGRLFNACENYEVEKQRHNEQINYNQDSYFFKQSCSQTHDTLCSHAVLERHL